ncbi:hypothetical protein [Nitrosomonas sp. Is37]|uniref:hypothetical protein n=1 Tax=Nitrosomonas sp. Is37 TaxID=3080535 RepID=UPI00294B2456|nr:hypothetical protein [Nitrosomonas sp. Is37]MDV6344901.1 hypothetical protein [Nitrosomonas sp. Is37]
MNARTPLIEMNHSHWNMACLVFAQPNYHHLGLLFRFLEIIATPTGIAICSAINDNPIENYLAENYANRCFQFPPESQVNSVAAEWTNIYPCAGFGDVPVVLANRDTEASTIESPFRGNRSAARVRFRRLDGLVGSERHVDIIHIAEPASRALDILEGSQAIILRDQPVMVIEINGLSNIVELARGLEALNFMLLDSLLLPVVDVESCNIHASVETETYFLGMPKMFLEENGLTKAFWPKDIYLAKHKDWQQALFSGFIREIRNGGIRFGFQPQTRYHYPFNDQLLCKGFYPAEYQEGHVWRWLGPKPSASIWIPKPLAGTYRFELVVIGALTEDVINSTRLFLNGVLHTLTRKTDEGVSTLITTIEIPIEEENLQIELVIAVSSTHFPNPDDPRKLGICISHLDLIPIVSGE